MTGPLLIGVGRNADVFAIDERRVLRRYRDGGDVTAEAAVMTYVAERGYPVPRIYAAAGTDLVMERVDGPTMLRALVAGDIGVEPAAEMLADLHGRLHRVPSRFGSGEGILHPDLHPDNVILASRGPMVIDWRNQAEGPSDLDVAVTAVILAQVAADESSGLAEPAEALMRSFLRQAGGNPGRMLDRAIGMRRADPSLTADDIGLLASAACMIHARLPLPRAATDEVGPAPTSLLQD